MPSSQKHHKNVDAVKEIIDYSSSINIICPMRLACRIKTSGCVATAEHINNQADMFWNFTTPFFN